MVDTFFGIDPRFIIPTKITRYNMVVFFGLCLYLLYTLQYNIYLLCGCCGASFIDRTGSTHASTPKKEFLTTCSNYWFFLHGIISAHKDSKSESC